MLKRPRREDCYLDDSIEIKKEYESEPEPPQPLIQPTTTTTTVTTRLPPLTPSSITTTTIPSSPTMSTSTTPVITKKKRTRKKRTKRLNLIESSSSPSPPPVTTTTTATTTETSTTEKTKTTTTITSKDNVDDKNGGGSSSSDEIDSFILDQSDEAFVQSVQMKKLQRKKKKMNVGTATVSTPSTTTRTSTSTTLVATAADTPHMILRSFAPPPRESFSGIFSAIRAKHISPAKRKSAQLVYGSLLRQMMGHNMPRRIPSLLQKQHDYLTQIVCRSITSKENSSVLVIGPSCSGKNLLVSHVFRCLEQHLQQQQLQLQQYAQKTENTLRYQLVTIRGEFLSTETSCHVQLKSQLDNPNTIFTLSRRKSHNSKNLDAREKHDDEMDAEHVVDDSDDDDDNGKDDEDDEVTLSRHLMYLENKLIHNRKQGICTIFVIDRFELVCMRAKRTLYHIANTSHMSTSHLVIIGLTTCQNIETIIDKRTLSRLLSRRIFTHIPNSSSQVRQLLTEIAEEALSDYLTTSKEIGNHADTKQEPINHSDDNQNITNNNGENVDVVSTLAEDDTVQFHTRSISQQIMNSLQSCTSEPRVAQLLQRSLASASGVAFYLEWFKRIVVALELRFQQQLQRQQDDLLEEENEQGNHGYQITAQLFTDTYSELTRNPMIDIINDLTTYELCFLIACKKCEEYGSRSSTQFITYNFLIAYAEYCKFISGGATTVNVKDADLFRDKLMRSLSLSKSIAMTSFEKLLNLGFLKLTGGGKKLVDSKGKKKDLSHVAIRFNGIHPVEMDKFLKQHKEHLNSEIYRWAVGG